MDRKTQAYRFLELAAISGEFPMALTARVEGTEAYKKKYIWNLRNQGFLESYLADGIHGYRLAPMVKEALLADNKERFSMFLEGDCDTNRIRSSPVRRLRLHRQAETWVTMQNAGIKIFRDEKPGIFRPGHDPLEISSDEVTIPAYYCSREIKESGLSYLRIKNSRMMGMLLTEQYSFLVYNTGGSEMKWFDESERRCKMFLETGDINPLLAPRAWKIRGIMLGNSMKHARTFLFGSRKHLKCFKPGGQTFHTFHYIPNSPEGEFLLKLLCRKELRNKLDSILLQDYQLTDSDWEDNYDAYDDNGGLVLFAYDLNLMRIQQFKANAESTETMSTVYCFDFQTELLQEFFEDKAKILSIEMDDLRQQLQI